MTPPTQDAIDLEMMARCIALSQQAVAEGEYPFACVIAKGREVIVETTNRVARDRDVTHHAELLAVSEAQRKLGGKKLKGCTLYTTVEPCPMCSFPMREARISRVVWSIRSPQMGGHTRWNVLSDPVLSGSMPEMFGRAPQIVSGLLQKEAEKVWWRMNPLVWGVIRLRGIFGGKDTAGAAAAALPLSNDQYYGPEEDEEPAPARSPALNASGR